MFVDSKGGGGGRLREVFRGFHKRQIKIRQSGHDSALLEKKKRGKKGRVKRGIQNGGVTCVIGVFCPPVAEGKGVMG